MAFDPLSSGGEKLLQEILDHRYDNGVCDSDYWEKRFDELDNDIAEDARIRSLFAELEDRDMIAVQWADNFPYYLLLKDRGLSYAQEKKKTEKENRKLSRREWHIAIVSAIIGAVVGLIPTIVQWLGGM